MQSDSVRTVFCGGGSGRRTQPWLGPVVSVCIGLTGARPHLRSVEGARAQGKLLPLSASSGLVCFTLPRPTFAPPMPCPPTWPDSPSSLAEEQEGAGSFQNVSIELQREAWQLEIVSRLLDNPQPNNPGMEEGGELSTGQPTEAALSPQKTSVPHYLCQSGSGEETENTPVN